MLHLKLKSENSPSMAVTMPDMLEVLRQNAAEFTHCSTEVLRIGDEEVIVGMHGIVFTEDWWDIMTLLDVDKEYEVV